MIENYPPRHSAAESRRLVRELSGQLDPSLAVTSGSTYEDTTVNKEHQRELFWAIRGGGGNFGVVTSMRIRLHAVDRVLAGLIVYPLTQAAKVLEQLNQILIAAPDELTVRTVAFTGPDGAPALFLLPTWSGDPALTQVGPTIYGDCST
jgi:FAD/FMN-containing dehydrogenase